MSRVIFCGNLPVDVRTREIEDIFYKYGKIIEVRPLFLLYGSLISTISLHKFGHVYKFPAVETALCLQQASCLCRSMSKRPAGHPVLHLWSLTIREMPWMLAGEGMVTTLLEAKLG